MTAPFATSPLAHRTPLVAGRAASLNEVPQLGLVSLRGAPSEIGSGAEPVLGTALPQGPAGTAQAQGNFVIWLGPDEWLIVTPPEGETAVAAGLERRLADTHFQAVVLSDYYTAIDVGGDNAWQLLAKLIAFDLHPRAFVPGMAVATLCAKAHVWIWLHEKKGAHLFRLFIRRSHADYLWCLLSEAGREWGLEPQDPVGRVALHLPHADH